MNMIELAWELSLSLNCQLVQPRLGSQEEIIFARKGLCFETHLNSGPIWSFKAVVASTPTTVISFGVKSKLMTVLALHISACWLFHFFKAVITYFLPLGQLSSPLATGFRPVVANVTHVFAPLRPSVLEISFLETYVLGHTRNKIKVRHVKSLSLTKSPQYLKRRWHW